MLGVMDARNTIHHTFFQASGWFTRPAGQSLVKGPYMNLNPNTKKLIIWDGPDFRAGVIALTVKHAKQILALLSDPSEGGGVPEDAQPTLIVDLGASWTPFQVVFAPGLQPGKVFYPNRNLATVNLPTKALLKEHNSG